MVRRQRSTRAWYGSKEPAAEEIIAAAEAAEGEPVVLYDHAANEGEYVDIARGLYDEMDSLKRTPAEFRTWTVEDGIGTFFQALLDFSPTDMRSRVSILQHLGSFKFRTSDGPEQKKAKVAAIFVEPEGEDDYKAILRIQAKKLADTWAPNKDTMLDYIVNQPAQMGRVLADRLNPANDSQFRIIGHPFKSVRSTDLLDLAKTKTVAYERDGEIHLVTDVREVLEGWDQDSAVSGGCEQFTLLDALLLHEVVELWLDENEPDVEVLEAHIIATTFERYLKDTLLGVAVEDFFLDWPQPSEEEMAESQRAEMEEQVAAWSASFDEDEMPDNFDDDVDGLPVDKVTPTKKKKKVAIKKEVKDKAKAPAKVQEGKLYRTRDGKMYRVVDGKKVAVKKKNST
ncbi:MAG: hypothetical protein ACI906_000035 [Candidatus Latescibacterota bacterium]